jgi:hypothetical protein
VIARSIYGYSCWDIAFADNYIECVRDDGNLLDKASMTAPDQTIQTCVAYCTVNVSIVRNQECIDLMYSGK